MSFPNMRGEQDIFFDVGITMGHSLDGIPVEDRFYTGHYDVTLYSDDYCMTDAWSPAGSYVEEDFVGDCDEAVDDAVGFSASLDQATGQAYAGGFHLEYNPTGDVAEDGVLNDTNVNGTYDVIVEMIVDEFDDGLTTVYSEGFEDGEAENWSTGGGSYGQIGVVSSGTDGVPSSSGGSHAVVDNNGSTVAGPYTFFGLTAADRDEWPENGFIVTADVYLDPTWADGEGFEWDAAVSNQSGTHRRDFIFHVVKDVSTSKLLVAGSNNSDSNALKQNLESGNHFVVTTAGWYTLQHHFRNDNGVLAVDMHLIDSNGSILWTETRSTAADIIANEIGSVNLGWFVIVDVAGGVHVDNVGLYYID